MIMGAWGMEKEPKLPYDAEVEYLESTGTQWIDTGFKATGGSKIEFRCLQGDKTANGLMVGSHNPSNNSSNGYNRYQAGIAGTNALKFNKCNYFEDFPKEFAIDSFHTFTFDARGERRIGYLDGEIVVDQRTNSVLAPVNNIVVWRSQYFSSTSVSACTYGKLAYLKIWNTADVLVRDMISISFTNELGQSEGAMYDRANPTVGMNPDGSPRTDGLYRNRGTGAFLWAEKQ